MTSNVLITDDETTYTVLNTKPCILNYRKKIKLRVVA